METIIIAILTGVILFEVIEHIVFPIVWYIVNRNKKSISGASTMLGTTARVTKWQGKQGRVMCHGESWKAESDTPLFEGQQVRIESVEGLSLKVKPKGD